MQSTFKGRPGRWFLAAALCAALAACSGGGGSPGETVGGGDDGGDVGAPGDRRSGQYLMAAADAEEYTLTLDFDRRTWRVAGGDVDRGGSFSAGTDGEFLVSPSNSAGPGGANTLRFQQFGDTVVGSMALGDVVVPFLASRALASSVAGAAGVYNMLGRTVDSAGPENTTIGQGEITADGLLRTCNDVVIRTIDDCVSVTQAPVTVNGTVFTAVTPDGAIRFRVFQVEGERIFVRASASAGTTRRFVVGTPAGFSFAAGEFRGGATDASWGVDTISLPAYARIAALPDGRTFNWTGTAESVGTGNTSLGNLLGITTVGAGGLFAIRSNALGLVAAARDSAQLPGYFAIGRRQ